MNEVDKNITQSLTYSLPGEINESIDDKYKEGIKGIYCPSEYSSEGKTSIDIFKENLIKSYYNQVLTEKPEENEW